MMRCSSFLSGRNFAFLRAKCFFLIIIFFINGILFWLGKQNSKGLCYLTSKDPLPAIKPPKKNDVALLDDVEDEFDWRKEMRNLALLVPVIENKSKKKSSQNKTSNYFHHAVVPTIASNLNSFQIISRLKETYNQPIKNRSVHDAADVYKTMTIYNCDDIKYLENRTINPVLTYGRTEKNEKKGEIHLHDGQTINIVTLQFERNQNDTQDPIFDRHLETFFKLLKMQDSPGIPRVYGACLLSKSRQDLVRKNNASIEIHHLTYILDRYDGESPLCKEEIPNENCVNLKLLRRFIKRADNPKVAVLRIIRGFGETFQSLWLNGVFPYKINLNDVIIKKDFQVVFKNVESFVFLDSDNSEFDFRRMFSGTMCKVWQHCTALDWQDDQLIFTMGAACKETRGFCSSQSRCWGIDSLSYLCIFSRWAFHQLIGLLPPTWDEIGEVKNLLDCASYPLPHKRCDWSFFFHGIEKVLEKAIEDWEKS